MHGITEYARVDSVGGIDFGMSNGSGGSAWYSARSGEMLGFVEDQLRRRHCTITHPSVKNEGERREGD